jgi:hypothetical protein
VVVCVLDDSHYDCDEMEIQCFHFVSLIVKDFEHFYVFIGQLGFLF